MNCFYKESKSKKKKKILLFSLFYFFLGGGGGYGWVCVWAGVSDFFYYESIFKIIFFREGRGREGRGVGRGVVERGWSK